MSLERIRELLQLMKEHDLAELELSEKDFSVKLKKAMPAIMATPAAPAPALAAAPSPPPAVASAAASDEGLVPIKSPIVGTFYRASAPDAQPFVNVGQKVTKETVVCIVEAMKIMNEIKAGVNGTIEKILVENGEPVEYGQPLFLVRP
ncbi:MAG: acetyl-CoA carboxylase biotin carboxyl carrier protein [Planctomycetota bacterium]|nr:acetyl-CoA carboxylase biotin carboxyl carrier protein [Planctomycetota bacterium]